MLSYTDLFSTAYISYKCSHMQYLIEHVCRQANHGKVVNYQDGFKVDRLPFRHNFWPQPYNDQVAQKDTAEWHRRVD